MNYAQLLTALGLETRLDLQEATKAGSCTIQFDSALDVTLEADGQGDQQNVLQLHASLGSVPASDREALFARLLQLHLFGLATEQSHFGFDPQLQRIVFFKTVMLAHQTRQEALAAVESFVNQSLRWRNFLPTLAAHDGAAAPKTHAVFQSV